MRKYWKVVRNTWDEMLMYRLSLVMWRVRITIHVLTLYFLWLAVLPESSDQLFGYTQASMLTYILVLNLVSALVTPTRSYAIGDDIVSGNLSYMLLKPIDYFFYWFSKDVGDRVADVLFSIIELSLLFFFLRPPFFIQLDPLYLLLFFIAMGFSLVLYFFFNLLLGFIGFWSAEIWAPRFIFYTIVSFFAGGYFPLDILPQPFFALFHALPFGNLLYFPVKIYLGQLSLPEVVNGLVVSFGWVLFFSVLIQLVWRRGLKVYTAQGG